MARKKVEAPPADEIRLLELTVQNFRGLRFAHVELSDEGRLIPVTGKNKAGKSSLLMGILSLVHGAKEAPEDPINDEAAEGEKSFVRGKFSNGFTVEERFTEKGRYLTVVSKDGGSYKQGTLNEWIDGVSGDPIHLWSLRDDRLMEVLLRTTTEPEAQEKIREFKEAEDRIRDERAPFNSAIQKIQRMEAPDGERPEPVDLMDLYSKAKVLREQEYDYQDMLSRRQVTDTSIASCDATIQELEERLASLRKKRESLVETREELDAKIQDTPNPTPERERVEAEITRADEQEQELEAWKRWDASQEELKAAKSEAERLTADLQEVMRQRGEYIAGIESKVPGLTFSLPEGETKIKPVLHGRGLHAASGAQRARFQIDTLFALNPRLKIVLLPDEGDAFDADYLKGIDAESRERGFQTWICRIQEGIEGEIKIVEGRTVKDEAEA